MASSKLDRKKRRLCRETSSTPASAATTPDLLHDIHVARTTACVLVEHNVALGRNSIRSGARLHAGTLECLGGFELLLPVGCVGGCLAAGSGPVTSLDLTKIISIRGEMCKRKTYVGS
jgi:hypothetical protein